MAQALQRRLNSIDVSDPRLYQDDIWRPLFAQLRRDDPVHYCETSPFGPYWSVTRYDDIFAVELDHENYSSSSELGGIQVTDQPKGQEFANFIRMDPPGHTAHRRTVAPIVAPSNLVNLEPLIRKRTSDVLDGLPRNETFDWVARVSTDLTNMMLATLFDFPWADREKLTWWSDVAIANVEASDAVVHSADERIAELTSMGEYFRKLWDARANAVPRGKCARFRLRQPWVEARHHAPPQQLRKGLAQTIHGTPIPVLVRAGRAGVPLRHRPLRRSPAQAQGPLAGRGGRRVGRPTCWHRRRSCRWSHRRAAPPGCQLGGDALIGPRKTLGRHRPPAVGAILTPRVPARHEVRFGGIEPTRITRPAFAFRKRAEGGPACHGAGTDPNLRALVG